MSRTGSKSTASPLSVARVVATLVTLGAIIVLTWAVMTDDTTLTLDAARVFAWAWLIFAVLFTIEQAGQKLRTTRARLRAVGGRR